MNELFTAEPNALRGSLELRHLLDKFGPMTGRYLAVYPKSWPDQFATVAANLGDVMEARMMTMLRRANEERRLIGGAHLPFNSDRDWLDNCKTLLESKPVRRLQAVVIGPRTPPERYHDVFELEEFLVPPTSEEQISAKPDEFLRVSKILLQISPEIGFIDPYLNPCDKYVAAVLKPLIKQAVMNKCESIRLWARAKVVLDKHTIAEVRDSLDSLIPQQTAKNLCVQMNLLDDDWSKDRLHPRYLITKVGGIRFDQGFKELSGGKKVDVAPISSDIAFNDIYRKYFEARDFNPPQKPPIVIMRNREIEV